jgi:hypothetical protein
MPHRVLGERQHRLRHAFGVADDPSAAPGHDAPAAITESGGLGQQRVGEIRQADRRKPQELPILRGSQRVEIIDEPAHPVELLDHQRHAVGPPVRIEQQQLQVPAAHGQWDS